MRIRKLPIPDAPWLRLASAAVLCLVPLVGGGAPAAATLAVTDALGREIHLNAPVERCVVLNENALEVLRMLGALDRVAAVSDYIARRRDFWPELSHLPTVGGWQSPNYETIAAVRPDVVLCYGKNPPMAMDRMLAPMGIPVLRQDFYRLNTLLREVVDLAALTGRNEAAAPFVRWHRRVLEQVAAVAAASGERPSVYLESFSDFKAWGPDSGASDMILQAGGRIVTADMAVQTAMVTPEWVVSKNPDVIIKTPNLIGLRGRGERAAMAAIRERIMNRPGWTNISAVRSGRVYVLSSEVCASPAGAVGIAWMARWLHPATDKHLDPAALHREYFSRFQKIAYRGDYAYPE